MRGVLLEVVPDAAITIDPRGGSIVASATEEDHKKLKEAIDEIVRLNVNDSMTLETYSLDKLNATEVDRDASPHRARSPRLLGWCRSTSDCGVGHGRRSRAGGGRVGQIGGGSGGRWRAGAAVAPDSTA